MEEIPKRILRSSLPKIEKKDKKPVKECIENFPFIEYYGKMYYYTTIIDCAVLCDKILTQVKESNDIFPIGFDMEWPFSFQTGSGKTALIQISPSLNECFLFHVSEFKKLPCALTELLSHTNVRLVGVNIKNDIHKLARDFPGVDSKPMLGNCIDASTQANAVLNIGSRRWSMEKLINHCFKMQINKDNRVRISKWHEIPLSKAQKQYAAIDAYASLKLYLYLKDLENALSK